MTEETAKVAGELPDNYRELAEKAKTDDLRGLIRQVLQLVGEDAIEISGRAPAKEASHRWSRGRKEAA